MRRVALGLLVALCLATPARALFMSVTGPQLGVVQSIVGITLSATFFDAPCSAGTAVGVINVQMNTGAFSGTLAISGAQASSFSLSSTTPPANLNCASSLGVGTYSINIVATQAGAGGSPFTQPFTITGANSFYVSPQGSDSNDGLAPVTGGGHGPFLTLDMCRSSMSGSSTKVCYVRAGTYGTSALTKHTVGGGTTKAIAALVLTSADNGETWLYYPPDGVNSAVLDGGNATTGQSSWCQRTDFFDIGLILSGASNVTINGFTFQHFTFGGVLVHGGAAPFGNWVPSPMPDTSTADSDIIENNIVQNINNGPNPLGFVGKYANNSCPTSAPYTGWPNTVNTDLLTGGMVYAWGKVTNLTVSHNAGLHMYGECMDMEVNQAGDTFAGVSVANNFCFDTCSLMNDCGAYHLYLTIGTNNAAPATGGSLTNNYFRDCGGGGGYQVSEPGFARCIYLDDQTSGITLSGNISAGHFAAANNIAHGGHNNTWTGNIVDLGDGLVGAANIGIYQTSASCTEPATPSCMGGNVWQQAIVISNAMISGNGGYGGGGGNEPLTARNDLDYAYSGSITDSAAVSTANPQFQMCPSGADSWGYVLAPNSVAYNSPVLFPAQPANWGQPGFWGPPGYTPPHSGTPPSYGPSCGGQNNLLPADRNFAPNWQMAGLLSLGGIAAKEPTTQCGATISPIGGGSDDSSAINTAITNCAAGQYVNLAAGTFTIAEGNSININKGVEVRGQGPTSTILTRPAGAGGWNNSGCTGGAHGATLGCLTGGDTPSAIVQLGGSATVTQTTTLSTDGALGSYTIQVASAAGFAVGGLVLVDELANGQSMADAAFNSGTGNVWAEPTYRVEWNSHNPNVAFFDSTCIGFGATGDNTFSCGTNGDECAYSIRCGGVQEELHLVTAISGNTITFDSPLTMAFRVANNAQARFYPTSSLVSYAAIENVGVSHGDNGNIIFQGCLYCWAKTVESSIWLNAGGVAFYKAAFRDQLEFSYIHNAAYPVNGGAGYAINSTYGASEDYIVNNIVMLANKVDVCRASCEGTVFAYNYMDDGYIGGNDTWVETGLNCSHLVGSHGCLFEGNLSFNSDSDFTHGSATHNTWFRNWLTGFRATFTSIDGTTINDAANSPPGIGPLRAIGDHAYSYWDSFIGNVAGKSGAVGSWTYRCAAGNADSGCAPALFNLGWNDTSVAGSLADGTMALSYPTTPNGANATITGPGCLTTPSDASNLSYCVPVVDGNFDYKTNAIQWATNDSAHTLPNSLYLSAKPTFFTAGSGYPWPWVTPNVSPAIQVGPSGCGGTCSALPAKARWDNGTPFTQP